jgi:hypothetical protein
VQMDGQSFDGGHSVNTKATMDFLTSSFGLTHGGEVTFLLFACKTVKSEMTHLFAIVKLVDI